MVKTLDDFIEKRLGKDNREPTEDKDKVKVLVVDDDPLVLAALKMILGRTYNVLTAESGAEGVSLLDPEVHAVILDVKMQGMDGFETYAEMRAVNANVPIIFHSAYQGVRDPYEVINEFRPFGYVQKGQGDDALARIVARAVEHYRQFVSTEKSIERLKNTVAWIRKNKASTVGWGEIETQLQPSIYKDPLTGLNNRLSFFITLLKVSINGLADKGDFTLAFVDVDDFSKIVDEEGSKTADRVLCRLADLIGKRCRSEDGLMRIGKDQFAVTLFDTDIDEARCFLENLRETVDRESKTWSIGGPGVEKGVTLSIGAGSASMDKVPSVERLLYLTELALMKAKQGGKNQCVCLPFI